MWVDVRLIILNYHHLYLVACPYQSVLLMFVGGGDLFHLSFVYQDGGGGGGG